MAEPAAALLMDEDRDFLDPARSTPESNSRPLVMVPGEGEALAMDGCIVRPAGIAELPGAVKWIPDRAQRRAAST